MAADRALDVLGLDPPRTVTARNGRQHTLYEVVVVLVAITLGGAAVNYAFIDHFQEVARAHFVVRRLERRYGRDAVRAAYERFSSESKAAA